MRRNATANIQVSISSNSNVVIAQPEVKVVNAEKILEQNSATHAVARDFCQIFEQDMDRLYLLSFLLTADESKGERCFAGALQDSARSPRVFKEWARSWARRMVVQNAIRMMRPSDSSVPDRATGPAAERPEFSAVLALPAFERFVFVTSVLECCSDQDCALLLESTRGEVIAARSRALQRIGSAAEAQRSAMRSGEQAAQRMAAMAMQVESVPLLPTLP
jgi:DNA-directed RNA polymerase specialized sigma24 family protein